MTPTFRSGVKGQRVRAFWQLANVNLCAAADDDDDIDEPPEIDPWVEMPSALLFNYEMLQGLVEEVGFLERRLPQCSALSLLLHSLVAGS